MKIFFDSSVLVPVFYADHQHHHVSAKAFLVASKEDFCALRTLGEVYATLTGLPVRPRITGHEGIAIVKQIRERLSIVSLTEQEYISTLEASPAVVGNTAYDALVARCALKAGRSRVIDVERSSLRKIGVGYCSPREDTSGDMSDAHANK